MRSILLATALLVAGTLSAAAQEEPRDNAEMAMLFAADQAARGDTSGERERILAADAMRQARTRELFEQGALTTCLDYFGAAFVFQHGREPEDFLLAHVFAVRSLALGCPDAEWIVAATLDRYLQNTGKPQIYGTQYRLDPGAETTMEPYDTGFLTDGVRRAAGVGTVSEQRARVPEMDALLRTLSLPPTTR